MSAPDGMVEETTPQNLTEESSSVLPSEQGADTPRSGLDLYISLCFLLITIVGLVFMQTRRFAFVWDDVVNVAGNPHMSPVTSETYRFFWENPYLDLYIPLTYTVFAKQAEYAISPADESGAYRFDPTVFHTTNLVLHLACVIFVFSILRTLTKHDGASFLGALLFGLHPLQVESASWVTETKGLLATSLALFAVWQYLLFAQRKEETRVAMTMDEGAGGIGFVGWLQLSIATIAYLLSLLAKPSVVVVPLLLILLQAGFLGYFRPRHWIAILLWLVPAVVITIVTRTVQSPEEDPTANIAPLWFRPFLVGFTITFYLYKLVIPLGLCADYGLTPELLRNSWISYVAWLLPAGLFVAMLKSPNRKVWLTTAGVFIVGMLPVIGLVPFGFQTTSTVADRYVYLSLLGPALALAYLLSRHWTVPMISVTGVVLATLGLLSFYQSQTWRDQQTLFEHALTINPDSVQAHHNIAQLHAAKGEIKTAFEHLNRVIEVRPNAWRAHADFAIGYAEMGKYPEAEKHARESLAVNPKNPMVRAALGFALAQQGKVNEAKTAFEETLAIDPKFPRALDGLGDILVRQGRPDEAIEYLQKAIDLNPKDANTHFHMGNALNRKGLIKEAIAEYRLAMSLDPKRLPGAIEVAWQLATNPDPSIRDGQQAFLIATQIKDKLTAPNAQVFDTLGAAKAELGEFEAAEKLALESLGVATQTGDIELQYRLKVRIFYYRNRRPYHQEPEQPRNRSQGQAQ